MTEDKKVIVLIIIVVVLVCVITITTIYLCDHRRANSNDMGKCHKFGGQWVETYTNEYCRGAVKVIVT